MPVLGATDAPEVLVLICWLKLNIGASFLVLVHGTYVPGAYIC